MATPTITQGPPVAVDQTLDKKHAHHLLHQMMRIRRLEDKSAELYSAMKIRGFLHLYNGEEAVAVGVMEALTPDDAVVATYREHGQALARGVSAGAIMAEMYGKVEGCSRGRGGSMHLFDKETKFYGGNAIVGGGIPMAVGVALADKMRGLNRVTCCFFGDGAVAEGEFHESMNLAALWQAPVLFICENNQYGMGTALEYAESETDIAKKAASYKIPAKAIDGMDVLTVEAAAKEAADAVRAGEGPQFLECRTYRFRAHSMFDAELYRDKSEVAEWREQRDPIELFMETLREQDLLTDDELTAIEREVETEIEEAVAFAEAGTWEPLEDLTRWVYSEPERGQELYQLPLAEEPAAETRTLTYREAVREAMCAAMQNDDRVFLMGEDVGRYGGCFAVSKGMLEEFGTERVIDTPLSESGFTGAGIGASLNGMLPIVEVMTVNFSMLALDQILNNAATILHMSGGLFNVPVVIRMATGGGKQLAAQHSHSLEGWYAHIPGIKVLSPATVEDARGMLETALADPDPVLIFENSLLYNLKEELPVNAGPVDISKAKVRRPGTDISIFTYSMSLHKALEAAEILAQEGIDCEVVDLRSLRPLDDETIMASVAKTHRVLIVDEGWRTGSIAAEIATRIMEQAFYELDAPVERLCSAEVPIPYAKHMEEAALPQTDEIVEMVRRMIHG
jgi:pyruvate dehydrogenase E1 component beta subunit/2-oxoisovalerate dehydrogenase E1 component